MNFVAECTTTSAPVLDRAQQHRRRQRVVDDQRHAGSVRGVGDGTHVEHVELRVAERLGEEQLGVGLDRRFPGRDVAGIDEASS